MAAKKSETALQERDRKKKELAEDLDYLRQVELPRSQGGGKTFIHDTRLAEKEEVKKRTEDAQNSLDGQAKLTYGKRLADYGFNRLQEVGFDKGWQYYCLFTNGEQIDLFGKTFATQHGILVVIKSPQDITYVRGIRITGNPIMDINAVDILVVQAENTSDSEKGLLLSDNKDTDGTLRKTEAGVWLPN